MIAQTCRITVAFHDERETQLTGHDQWALDRLIHAGAHGVTQITEFAVSCWTACIFKLRKLGIEVSAILENHRSEFVGHHAGYVPKGHAERAADGNLASGPQG